jgi:hypothetical protein
MRRSGLAFFMRAPVCVPAMRTRRDRDSPATNRSYLYLPIAAGLRTIAPA